MIKKKEKKKKQFYLQDLLNTFFFWKINILKNWLRDHSSWALCGIWMKIEGFLKSCFLILLYQGTLSFLSWLKYILVLLLLCLVFPTILWFCFDMCWYLNWYSLLLREIQYKMVYKISIYYQRNQMVLQKYLRIAY